MNNNKKTFSLTTNLTPNSNKLIDNKKPLFLMGPSNVGKSETEAYLLLN
jgi:hypothetical protein